MKALIVVEHKDSLVKNINKEIATALKKLGVETDAIIMGENTAGIAKVLGKFGVQKVYAVEKPELSTYSQDLYAHTVSELVKQNKYYLVTAGTSPFGKDLLPRIAA